jgi:ribonuclease T
VPVFYPKDVCHFHIEPFKGANLEAAALKFNGIDVHNPLRMAVSEKQALALTSSHSIPATRIALASTVSP